MLDCLANAIGIMSWGNDDNDGVVNDHGGDGDKDEGHDVISRVNGDKTSSSTSVSIRYFEPILSKGISIPTTKTKRFLLHSRSQSFVTLDIYEEIEDIRRCCDGNADGDHVESGSSSSNSDGDNTSKVVYIVNYKYHHIVTVDVPVPKYQHNSHHDGENISYDATTDELVVYVAFSIDNDSILRFNITRTRNDNNEPNRIDNHNDDDDDEKLNITSYMLIVYLIFIFILYILIKIYIKF